MLRGCFSSATVILKACTASQLPCCILKYTYMINAAVGYTHTLHLPEVRGKKATLMRLLGQLYSVLWLELESNGSWAEYWSEMNHLCSVPGWWCHRGHVNDTSLQQWHVDPGGFRAWPDSWLVQVDSDRTDTFVRHSNTHTHTYTYTITHMPECTIRTQILSFCLP